MSGINVKDLILDVAKIEGKKKQVNIAQLSETVSITLKLLGKRFNSDEHDKVTYTLRIYGGKE